MPTDYCDTLYVQWNELSATQQRRWGSEYAYGEFGIKRCKVRSGFVSGKGNFYDCITDVPPFHNSMMVFRIGIDAVESMRTAAVRPPANA